MDEDECIGKVSYEVDERWGRGREALYIGCVYMPTDSSSDNVIDSVYEQLKEDVLVPLLVDFLGLK